MDKHVYYWLTFALAGFFAIMYKAVMSAGSELTPWRTTKGYLKQKPVSTAMRFLLAQLAYFWVLANPSVMGNVFDGVAVFSKVSFSPYILAGVFGLASDKVADVVMTIGSWIAKKFSSIFGSIYA
jgi:hypothetical protein